jgi:5-methylcytosine-specific restriction endonuclease McrA
VIAPRTEYGKARGAERSRAWYAANKDRAATRGKAYHDAHKDQMAACRRAYYEAHKAERAAKQKAWRDAHRAEQKAWRAAYYTAHKAERAAAVLTWRASNPLLAQTYRHRSSARARGAETIDLTAAEWGEILSAYGHRCAYCGADGDIEQDHIVPLSQDGAHTAQNVTPACPSCNSSKRNRTPAEWLASATFPERARARVEALLLGGTA